MPDLAADKVLFLHRRRLVDKYGAGGARRLVASIDRLIAADADRGVHARRVDLSATRSLQPYGLTGVSDATDVAAVVNAVQTVTAAAEPDYVVLVGGPDVIPHTAVRNPLAGTADPDPNVPSDLPYATTGGFTDDPAALVALQPGGRKAPENSVQYAVAQVASRYQMR